MNLHINLYGKIVTDYPELTQFRMKSTFFRSKLDLEIDRLFTIAHRNTVHRNLAR